MSTLYLGNTDTAAMAPNARQLSDHFLRKAATSAKRMIWMADVGDQIVTPTPLSAPFREYVATTMGHVALPESFSPSLDDDQRPLPLTPDVISGDPRLAPLLERLSADNRVNSVHPYIADEVAESLAAMARSSIVSFDAREPAGSTWVTRHLNDKSAFREFAGRFSIPVPTGAIFEDQSELLVGIAPLLVESGSVIIKMARHSSGEGNLIVNGPTMSHVAGAASAISVESPSDRVLQDALTESGIVASKDCPVIAEAYYENKSCLGLHYSLRANSVELVGAADQINRPTVVGQFWGADVLADLPTSVREWSTRLADYAYSLGYRGPLSVDLIESRDGGFMATEVNGRHGGFSTIRAMIDSLGLKSQVENGERVALIQHGIPLPYPFAAALSQLTRAGLEFDSSDGLGAVLMTEGYRGDGPYDVVTVGRDRADAEDRVARLLGLAGARLR